MPGRIDRGLRRIQRGDRFIARLIATTPCAASATVREVSAFWCSNCAWACTREACAACICASALLTWLAVLPPSLAFGVLGLLQQEVLAGRGCLSCVAGCRKVIALDGRDQLAGLHAIPFVDFEGLNPPGDAGADDHFIGIHRADKLQIVGAFGGEEIPAERDDEQQSENDEDPVARIHRAFLRA